MNVYTCNDFQGFSTYTPAAVIVADSAEAAKALLEARLAAEGLTQVVPVAYIYLLDTESPATFLLADGN